MSFKREKIKRYLISTCLYQNKFIKHAASVSYSELNLFLTYQMRVSEKVIFTFYFSIGTEN